MFLTNERCLNWPLTIDCLETLGTLQQCLCLLASDWSLSCPLIGWCPLYYTSLVTPRVLTMHFTPARVEVSSQPGHKVWWPGDTENTRKQKTCTSVTLESTFKWNTQWQHDPRTNNLSERTLHVLSSSSQSVYIAIIHEATIAPMCYTMSQSWGTMNVWGNSYSVTCNVCKH